jgi:hypothetical protein
MQRPPFWHGLAAQGSVKLAGLNQSTSFAACFAFLLYET